MYYLYANKSSLSFKMSENLAYRLLSFKLWSTKLDRFSAKNEKVQRQISNLNPITKRLKES